METSLNQFVTSIEHIEQRKAQHLLARNHIANHQFKEALDILSAAKEKFGSNIALLADITSCLFMLGREAEWKHYFQLTATEYEARKNSLSINTRFDVCIILAKFMENEGQVASALELYQQCLKILKPDQHAEQYYRVVANFLRVSAQYDLNSNLAEYYTTLSRIDRTENSFISDMVEVQHSLILAEFLLIEPTTACERLLKLFAMSDLEQTLKNIIFFDVIDLFLRKDIEIDRSILGFKDLVQPEDYYEQSMFDFVFKHKSPQQFSIDFSQMSVAHNLRFYSLLLSALGPGQQHNDSLRISIKFPQK